MWSKLSGKRDSFKQKMIIIPIKESYSSSYYHKVFFSTFFSLEEAKKLDWSLRIKETTRPIYNGKKNENLFDLNSFSNKIISFFLYLNRLQLEMIEFRLCVVCAIEKFNKKSKACSFFFPSFSSVYKRLNVTKAVTDDDLLG